VSIGFNTPENRNVAGSKRNQMMQESGKWEPGKNRRRTRDGAGREGTGRKGNARDRRLLTLAKERRVTSEGDEDVGKNVMRENVRKMGGSIHPPKKTKSIRLSQVDFKHGRQLGRYGDEREATTRSSAR